MNSPSTFQRIMELIFGDLHLSELILNLDDVLVFSKTVPEHIDRLKKVFQRFCQHGLKLKGAKCQLFKTQVAYLGLIVSKEGVAFDPGKSARVRDWPTPSTQAELLSFLSLAIRVKFCQIGRTTACIDGQDRFKSWKASEDLGMIRGGDR